MKIDEIIEQAMTEDADTILHISVDEDGNCELMDGDPDCSKLIQ